MKKKAKKSPRNKIDPASVYQLIKMRKSKTKKATKLSDTLRKKYG